MKKAFCAICFLLSLSVFSCFRQNESRVRMYQLLDSIRVTDSLEALQIYESLHPVQKDTARSAAVSDSLRPDTLRPVKKPVRRAVRDSAAKAPLPAAPESPKDTNP